MIVIGSKGFAREVLDVLEKNGNTEIFFFDNVNVLESDFLYNKYLIYKSFDEIKTHFEEKSNKYTLGLGNPKRRELLANQLNELGGSLESTISCYSKIGNHDVYIGRGSNILHNALISNSTSIGMGCIIYYNVQITHDCEIGNFVQISPNVTVLGRVKIGDHTVIGASATILPDIVIGKNVIIGAGAVVVNNISDSTVVAGVPAKYLRQNL